MGYTKHIKKLPPTQPVFLKKIIIEKQQCPTTWNAVLVPAENIHEPSKLSSPV